MNVAPSLIVPLGAWRGVRSRVLPEDPDPPPQVFVVDVGPSAQPLVSTLSAEFE